jgi:signal transduction histidine kinase
LADSVALVDRALHNARALALNLRPPLLDDLGLIPSLRWLADQQTLHTGLLMTFTAGTPEQRLDPAVEISCFRITQEALNNVVKHARARTVTVDLTQDTGFLRVRVRDDGCGFDQAEALHGARSGASFGLIGMEERATLLGGGIEWHSTPGQGTEVHFWLPLTRV